MDLRYPIGQFEPQPFSEKLLRERLTEIQILPQLLEQAVNNLDKAQLDTPYREGGWTVQQVVHHVADSHINAYCRVKLGLTENNPTIKPYEEQLWAELHDTKDLPINISITLLFALHARLYEVLRNISHDDYNNRTVYHPASKKTITLWDLLGTYVWHGQHHVAHITTLRDRMGWM